MKMGSYKTKITQVSHIFCDIKSIQPSSILCGTMLTLALCLGAILSSTTVSADDSVVDEINITVPVSCTMSGTGMNTHNADIANGIYTPDIGTTTLHAFCNDNEGFAIYAAGYTGNEIGATNSNKLVGTSASGNSVIESGIATSAGSPDISNWAMKLTMTQDSGDTTSTNAFTIDSAPNVDLPSQAEQGATSAPFSSYHTVPNEYTKVAHKNSMTDMAASTGGVKLTTTYAAYISKTQPADTYSGQVIYTLVHPANAPAPIGKDKVGVTYHANGSTFAGGADTNYAIFAESPMYIATTPLIAKSSNVAEDGTKNTAYASDVNETVPVTVSGAKKMKVVVTYGVTSGTGLAVIEGSVNDGGKSTVIAYDTDKQGVETYIIEGDTVTFVLNDFSSSVPVADYDYGFWAQVYPIYITEQTDTELSDDYHTYSPSRGNYTQPVDWRGSWYADIDGEQYDFLNVAEIEDFITNNVASLGGKNIDLYRGLSFVESYQRAGKPTMNFNMQEASYDLCRPVAVTQTQVMSDIRDGSTYMVGRLRDGNCWMLENLALDPTDSVTANNMNADNTNATTEAITNYLNGGSSTTGWSSEAIKTATYLQTSDKSKPRLVSRLKDTFVQGYGPASVDGRSKTGIYYNYCAATVGTYCYSSGAIDVQDTLIDAPQDICPASWRMPTGGEGGEYATLINRYNKTQDATNVNSLQYNLSVSISNIYYNNQTYFPSNGYWWTSTYTSTGSMYSFEATSGSVSAAAKFSNDERWLGQTMRCIVNR